VECLTVNCWTFFLSFSPGLVDMIHLNRLRRVSGAWPEKWKYGNWEWKMERKYKITSPTSFLFFGIYFFFPSFTRRY
jgi:hypothetical protein